LASGEGASVRMHDLAEGRVRHEVEVARAAHNACLVWKGTPTGVIIAPNG
jgi:hypothetical protein